MKTNFFWQLTSLVVLLAMIISPIGFGSAAPLPSQPAAPHPGARVIYPSYVGVSQPLRDLAPIKIDPNAVSELSKIKDRLAIPKTQNDLPNGSRDNSIVQDRSIGPLMPSPIANFEGVNNVNGVLPPDTQGDIGTDPGTGKKYYVQWVNLSFEIWDVSTPGSPVSLYGPAAGNTLWTGTGTLCASYNDGDPITQFDHLANRWMMSQFGLQFPNNFHQCIADFDHCRPDRHLVSVRLPDQHCEFQRLSALRGLVGRLLHEHQPVRRRHPILGGRRCGRV